MKRLWVSLLTVLFYGLAQILPGLVLGSHLLGDMSNANCPNNDYHASIYLHHRCIVNHFHAEPLKILLN